MNLKIYLSTLCLSFFISEIASAQVWELTREKDITTPQTVSLDKKGNLYWGGKGGNIHQYLVAEDSLVRFSPRQLAAVHLIEAWETLQVFALYQDFQEYVILDRFMRPVSADASYVFPSRLFGFIQMASFSADDNLWVFDNSEFSLKKYDPNRRELVSQTDLSLILDPGTYDISFLREYQNQVFLVDRQVGIHIFDNLGNYKKTLPTYGSNYLGVWEDEVYYLKGGQLRFYHLYTQEKREIKLPTAARDAHFALLWENQLALFSENKLRLYEREIKEEKEAEEKK